MFIASDVRSGSTYIAEIIAYTLFKQLGWHTWGLTKETFNVLSAVDDPSSVSALLGTLHLDSSGYKCAKLMVHSLSIIHRLSADETIKSLFFGENTYWIFVRRSNRVGQAVSLAVAQKTGLFHEYEDRAVESEPPSMVEIKQAHEAVSLSWDYLQLFSEKCSHSIHVEYEKFKSDISRGMASVGRFLGVDLQTVHSELGEPKIKATDSQLKDSLAREYGDWLLSNQYSS